MAKKKKAARARGTTKKSTPRKPSTRHRPTASRPQKQIYKLIFDVTDVVITCHGNPVREFFISVADENNNPVIIKKSGSNDSPASFLSVKLDGNQFVAELDAEEVTSLHKPGGSRKMTITMKPLLTP